MEDEGTQVIATGYLFGYDVKPATLPALLTINIRHPYFSRTFSQQEPTTRVLKVEISEK